MKIFKKLIFGIIISTALYAITYFFIKYYNPSLDINNFFQNYKLYAIVLYISIITIYVLFTSNHKIYKILLGLVILINFIRLTSFFTIQTLGISQYQFYILISIFILMILTTYIKNWIRYIIMTILVIPFGIILLNNFLPIYNDGPDFDGFYETRDTLLIIQSTDPDSLLLNTESTITIKSPEKEKTLQITNGYTSQPIKVESGLQIIFASKTGLNNTYTYILTPNGTIASLTAQSIINLNIKEPKLEIIQGNIKIYTGYNENNGNVSSIIMDYNKDRNNYLIQQIGGEAILNSTFDKFIRGYLNIVNSIFSITSYLPIEINLSYQQNILNYQEFHKYLPYQTNTNLGSTVADNEMIINQANEGINNTKAKQRFNSTKKFFNSFNK